MVQNIVDQAKQTCPGRRRSAGKLPNSYRRIRLRFLSAPKMRRSPAIIDPKEDAAQILGLTDVLVDGRG
jgi:hypothetical protein